MRLFDKFSPRCVIFYRSQPHPMELTKSQVISFQIIIASTPQSAE